MTSTFGGDKVSKGNPRVEAYGTVDELTAQLGVALLAVQDPRTKSRARRVQEDLFAIGAHLASPRPAGRRVPKGLPALPQGRVQEFEAWIDESAEVLPPLRSFILPGGAPGAAQLHLARTVCRRAERRIVELSAREFVDPMILVYANRLSDYLFSAARHENLVCGQEDVPWTHGSAGREGGGEGP